MRKLLIATLVLWKLSLLAVSDRQGTQITAKYASGDTRHMILSGDVTVKNDLGILKAENIKIDNTEKNGPISCSRCLLEDRVYISFTNGDQLNCDRADINCESLQGVFLSQEETPKVVYHHVVNDSFFQISSHQMNASLVSNTENEESSFSLDRVDARRDVSLNYSDRLFITADQTVYSRKTGIVDIYVDIDSSCTVTDDLGNCIFADHITADMNDSIITLFYPQGVVSSAGEEERFSKMWFSAKTLKWEKNSLQCSLSGGVDVELEEIGRLQNDDEVRFVYYRDDGHIHLSRIEGEGNTALFYRDPMSIFDREIFCYGRFAIDHQKKEIRLSGPDNGDGVQENLQIVFRDGRGEIHADKAFITYSYDGHHLKPQKFALAGNVRLSNRLPLDDTPLAHVQYVLADRVDVFPDTKEMRFRAAPGRRVLFLDRKNELEISAPALQIVRDQETNKETFKGIGDVRFSLAEKELVEIQKKFMNFQTKK